MTRTVVGPALFLLIVTTAIIGNCRWEARRCAALGKALNLPVKASVWSGCEISLPDGKTFTVRRP